MAQPVEQTIKRYPETATPDATVDACIAMLHRSTAQRVELDEQVEAELEGGNVQAPEFALGQHVAVNPPSHTCRPEFTSTIIRVEPSAEVGYWYVVEDGTYWTAEYLAAATWSAPIATDGAL